MTQSFTGVFTVMPTPFDDDGRVLLDDIPRLVDFLVGMRIDGLTVLGVTSEAHKLTEPERDAILSHTLTAVRGRVPVIVGATHNSTDVAIQFSRRVEEYGATGIMISPPSVAKHNLEEVLQHLCRVAEAISLPVVLQDFPPQSGIFMSPEFISRVANSIKSVTGIKLEDPPTALKIARIRSMVDSSVGIFGGLGGTFFLHELQCGAIGTMTGFAYPEVLVEIYRLYISGDTAAAADVYYRFVPLLHFEAQAGIGLSIRKEVFRRRGALSTSKVRDSGSQLSPSVVKQLDETLARVDLS